MLPIVATIRESSRKDWTNYFRVAIREDGRQREWTRLKCNWLPLLVDHGTWDYTSRGELLLVEAGTKKVFNLDKLHWNFRALCKDRELTGSGLLLPQFTKITWVMGTPSKKVDDDIIEFDLDYIKGKRPKPSPTRRFKIRSMGGVSPSTSGILKGGIQGDAYLFEIVDETGRSKRFLYDGAGLALPGLLAPFAPSGPGPFTNFQTSQPVTLEDFEGAAMLGQDPVIDPGPSSPFRGLAVGGKLRLSPESDRLTRAGAIITSKGGKGGIIPIESGVNPGGAALGSVSKGALIPVK